MRMPQPQQKDLLTNRWRQVRAPDPKESQIQISLIAQLRFRCRPDVLFFHVPNGELRDKRAAAKLKAMGTLPGVADLVFVWNDPAPIQQPCLRTLFLELKARGGKTSPEQRAFADRAFDVGADYHVADNIDLAIDILKAHNLLAR